MHVIRIASCYWKSGIHYSQYLGLNFFRTEMPFWSAVVDNQAFYGWFLPILYAIRKTCLPICPMYSMLLGPSFPREQYSGTGVDTPSFMRLFHQWVDQDCSQWQFQMSTGCLQSTMQLITASGQMALQVMKKFLDASYSVPWLLLDKTHRMGSFCHLDTNLASTVCLISSLLEQNYNTEPDNNVTTATGHGYRQMDITWE